MNVFFKNISQLKFSKIFFSFFFLFVCDQTYKSVCDYGKTFI